MGLTTVYSYIHIYIYYFVWKSTPTVLVVSNGSFIMIH